MPSYWEDVQKRICFLVPFFLGTLLKEIINFIKEGGCTKDYPLSKSLFIMFISLIVLVVLGLPFLMAMRDLLLALVRKVDGIEDDVDERLTLVERRMGNVLTVMTGLMAEKKKEENALNNS